MTEIDHDVVQKAGAQMREIRMRSSLSQSDQAARKECSPSTLRLVERGEIETVPGEAARLYSSYRASDPGLFDAAIVEARRLLPPKERA